MLKFGKIDNEILFWKELARSNRNKAHMDVLLGRYKSEEFRNLIKKWVGNLEGKNVLKTDLHEEAFGEDEILFSLSERGFKIFALDIAEQTTQSAHFVQKEKGFSHQYITADVRNLPFKDNIFDVILSSSTLDHFNLEKDLLKSLLELKRVIKLGGNLIITLNNKHNINFYLMLKLERILGLISYPVQFYSIHKLRKIVEEVGLSIQDRSYIVHIVSPLNSILLLLRRCANKNIVDRVAKFSISLFNWLGNRRSKSLTGCFIALNCVKKID